jgi:Flp pilus assembly pilin Flp
MNLRTASRRLARDTRGANLVEYIMLVGLIAIICISVFTRFGNAVKDHGDDQAGKIENIGK